MTDADIVALYWARDEQAIAQTAQKFGAYCRKIAMNLLGSQEDAEECENQPCGGAAHCARAAYPAKPPWPPTSRRPLPRPPLAPDMPMLDAAAPQAADADEGSCCRKGQRRFRHRSGPGAVRTDRRRAVF